MHVKIKREALIVPLSKVVAAAATPSDSDSVITSHVLVSLDENRLTITGTDTKTEVFGHLGAGAGGEPGRVTIPARKLLDICRSFGGDDEIEMTSQAEGRILIAGGSVRFVIAGLPPDDFPVAQSADPDKSISLDFPNALLQRMLAQTRYAMAGADDARRYLSGMLWELSPEKFCTVATDGHRLALCQIDIKTPATETRQIIVPRKSIEEITTLLQSVVDEQVRVILQEQHLRLEASNYELNSQLISGNFPDYDRVIPQDRDKEVIIDRQAVIDLLCQVAILSDDRYRNVEVNFAAGEMRAKTKNIADEEADGALSVDYRSDTPLSVTFKVDYLLDAFRAIEWPRVSMRLSNAESSCLIAGVPAEGEAPAPESDSWRSLCVVMPMLF